MPEMLRPANTQPRLAQENNPAARNPAKKGDKPANVVRGHIDDPPAKTGSPAAPPSRLSMPSPEELGLVAPATKSAAVPACADWPAARARLDKLGAVFYRLEKEQAGGFRFSCALPHAKGGATQQQFEARAASEQDAIRLAMQQVEAWAGR